MPSKSSWKAAQCVAFRLSGNEGWRLGVFDGPPDDALHKVEKTIDKLLEARLVARLGVSPDDTISPELVTMSARMAGWVYDDLAECWRAPGEAVRYPAGPAPVCKQLVCKMDPARHGWMRLRLSADAQTTVIRLSAAYDPLQDLLSWLERLSSGRDASVRVNEEGRDHVLHAFVLPDRPNFLRLHVVKSRSGSEVVIDAQVPTRELVASLYASLRSIIRHPRTTARHWVGYGGDEPPQGITTMLRSEAIENFLKN